MDNKIHLDIIVDKIWAVMDSYYIFGYNVFSWVVLYIKDALA